jgi:hypothetical protein
LQHTRLIITAASESYGSSLVALLGSLAANWPGHPPVLVYDIGLHDQTLATLDACHIPITRVPTFCPHWRDHYTWKIWCLNDALNEAPAASILWMDATLVVLQPLDEIFEAAESLGYFFTGNGEMLDWEASEEACHGCQVSPAFRLGKPTLAATLMAFGARAAMKSLLVEALSVAMTERHIKATSITHRHDQAILSLLAYRTLGHILMADQAIYLGSLQPQGTAGQKIWHHRRRLRPEDADAFRAHLSGLSGRPGPHVPLPPASLHQAQAEKALYKVHWYYGQHLRDEAAARLRMALAVDPALATDPQRLARSLLLHRAKLRPFLGDEGADGFVDWVLSELRALAGDHVARQVGASVGKQP